MVPCREPLYERVSRRPLKSASTPGLLFRRECFPVDNGFICAIIYIGKGAADRRFAPPTLLRSNRQVGSLGRLLLFCQQNDFDNQTDETDDECTKQKQFRICNHVVTPFPVRTGGKEDHPLLLGEKPPTVTGNALVPKNQCHIIRHFGNCQFQLTFPAAMLQ